MTEEFNNALRNAGVDLDGSITRFSGNQALYERFLNKFTEDTVYSSVVKAFQEKDYEAAASSVHTLKGMSGNLGIIPLYQACSNTMDYLRSGDIDNAVSSYSKIKDTYQEIISVIQAVERG